VYLVGIQVQALTLLLLSSVSSAKPLHSASSVDSRHCLSLGVPVLAGTVRAELWSMAVCGRGRSWLDARGTAYFLMRSPGGRCPGIASWQEVSFSPCGPLVGLFCRADMPPYGPVLQCT